MQPTYPYLPGTVENDWRNVIYGSLAGQPPSNAIGVDGNYFFDIDTGNIWGPKAASVWGAVAASLFHNVNTIYGATNGAAPPNTVGIDGDYFVDYQTNKVFGPKAGGAWPSTPVASFVEPANTIFGNSAGYPPSNSVGLDGYYFFDVSTSEWYGPKASGAWPTTPVPVAGGANIIFGNSGGGAPSNSVGTVGSYFYDISGGKYYGPKTTAGWPTTPHDVTPPAAPTDANTVSDAVGGGAPSNGIGFDAEFFVDADTGKLWGPKAAGVWPTSPRYTPLVSVGAATDSNTMLGNSQGNPPDNSIGHDGDYFWDITSGNVYGPKASGAWPTAPVRPGSGLIDVQQFDTDGTWLAPPTYKSGSRVIVELWGGGGGSWFNGGAGSGGDYAIYNGYLGQFPATLTVQAGLGGIASHNTVPENEQVTGGHSIFGSNSYNNFYSARGGRCYAHTTAPPLGIIPQGAILPPLEVGGVVTLAGQLPTHTTYSGAGGTQGSEGPGLSLFGGDGGALNQSGTAPGGGAGSGGTSGGGGALGGAGGRGRVKVTTIAA